MTEKPVYIVNAEWDAETRRWTATSDDIPGLMLETDTMEEILDCIEDVAIELIEANCGFEVTDIPVFLQAHYATRLKPGHA